MIPPWIEEYILLALRMDQAFRRLDDWPFVDFFYGPSELKARIEKEEEPPAEVLARAAITLGDTLPSQNFERDRAGFLEKQISAMETLCRKLSGQRVILQEVIQGYLDLEPTWQPESDFKQALDLLDQALPGTGDLRARYQRFREETALRRPELVLSLASRMVAEARRRTRRFLELPEEEAFDFHAVREVSYGAANWYLGGYRSRLELNIDRPASPFSLLYQMCHEAYPGHHTEFVMKEKHLYLDRGFTEQSLFIVGPQLVIAEGIASLAQEMIFTPEEAEVWLKAQNLAEAGIALNHLDLPKVIQALGANMLDDLESNLALMLWDGRSDEELVAYAMAYTPFTGEQIRRTVQSLKSPLRQIYAFTYSQGKRLMRPLLQGANRWQVFRRLLTEPVYPSLLAEWSKAGGR
ncbi:MAG: hypothetical protein HPY59_03590 [Anaerolineae bacterium]|nr:hypothetical protein [Anaerolineae bacterium]